MENNNPWLEITKQDLQPNLKTPPNVLDFILDHWRKEQNKHFENSIPYVTTHLNVVVNDSYSEDDLEEAREIISIYHDSNGLDEFCDGLSSNLDLYSDAATSIYHYLYSSLNVCNLIDFMYENHIWD